MSRGSKHKDRLLKLLSIFQQESSEVDRFSITKLLEKLNLDDSQNNRRNIRNDIVSMRKAGFDIQFKRHKAPEYYLANRTFTSHELNTLVDIVQSSRAIPENMSEALSEKIISLSSLSNSKKLKAKIRPNRHAKMENIAIFENIATIQDALASSPKYKISFKYFHYDAEFNKKFSTNKDDGTKTFKVTPIVIVYQDSNYYLISSDDDKSKPIPRRIDRMEDVEVTNELGIRQADLQNYEFDPFSQFGMFIDRDQQMVSFIIKNKLGMGVLLDRFGKDNIYLDTKAKPENPRQQVVRVKVVPSPQFYGWCAGVNDILSLTETLNTRPKSKYDKRAAIIEEYKKFLNDCLDSVSSTQGTNS